MLQPKRTKYRKAHKGRIKGAASSAVSLSFGSHGLKAQEPARITARQIEAARRAMTRQMKRAGRVCTTNQIIRHVWGFAGQQARSIVATSIWRLRAKLEDDPQQPQRLITVRHVGYKYDSALATAIGG